MIQNFISRLYEKNKNFVPIVLMIIITVMIIACKHGPAVPHEFTSTSADSCRVCHEKGDNGAPMIDHADRDNCLRCHDAGDNLVAEGKAE